MLLIVPWNLTANYIYYVHTFRCSMQCSKRSMAYSVLVVLITVVN